MRAWNAASAVAMLCLLRHLAWPLLQFRAHHSNATHMAYSFEGRHFRRRICLSIRRTAHFSSRGMCALVWTLFVQIKGCLLLNVIQLPLGLIVDSVDGTCHAEWINLSESRTVLVDRDSTAELSQRFTALKVYKLAWRTTESTREPSLSRICVNRCSQYLLFELSVIGSD